MSMSDGEEPRFLQDSSYLHSNYSLCPETAVKSKSLFLPTVRTDQFICTQSHQTQTETNLHDVEEHFLAQAVFLLEEFVLRISAGDVSANQLLAG